METHENYPVLNQTLDELTSYLKSSPHYQPMLWDLLYDLNDYKTELSVSSIFNKLAFKFKQGWTMDQLTQYVNRSKRVFLLAGGFVQNTYADSYIIEKIQTLHQQIHDNFNDAITLFASEYNVQATEIPN